MPAAIKEPLAVVFHLPGEDPWERAMHDLPDPKLAADLARALAASAHPHGGIKRVKTARGYSEVLRRMAKDLHREGFRGALVGLTPSVLLRYFLTRGYTAEGVIRQALRSYHSAGGELHRSVVTHLEGRRVNAMPSHDPHTPYSEAEWDRLTSTCVEILGTAHKAHQDALAAAARGKDPLVHGFTPDNLAWLIRQEGPAVVINDTAHRIGREHYAEISDLCRALFPDFRTLHAYRLLFAMRTGITAGGISGLAVDSVTRTGPHTALLTYFKGRTGLESLNLPRDAVRLLDRWEEHATPLREHAGDSRTAMWLYITPRSRSRARFDIKATAKATDFQWAEWVTLLSLTGEEGAPLSVDGGRIRATYHHRRDRSAWSGTATIDPNHSAQVEADHYLTSHTPAQMSAIEGVIEDAARDVRRKAEPPVIFDAEDAAAFAEDFPHLVEEAGLSTGEIKALLSGEQDMFVAACADPLNGPHAPAGTLCPARPWVCLLCPLAAFAPRHLPNLLRLKNYFSRQAEQMTTRQFVGVFGPYVTRLDDDILPRFNPAAVKEASRVTAPDVPFHLEEMPL